MDNSVFFLIVLLLLLLLLLSFYFILFYWIECTPQNHWKFEIETKTLFHFCVCMFSICVGGFFCLLDYSINLWTPVQIDSFVHALAKLTCVMFDWLIMWVSEWVSEWVTCSFIYLLIHRVFYVFSVNHHLFIAANICNQHWYFDTILSVFTPVQEQTTDLMILLIY